MTSALIPLSSDEEIALRRIAHGSSVSPRMAARLQDLAFIQRTNGVYRLTPLGQLRHDALPKAPLLTRPRTINGLTNYVVGLIDKAQSDARVRASARSEASIATRQDLEQEILSLIQIIETTRRRCGCQPYPRSTKRNCNGQLNIAGQGSLFCKNSSPRFRGQTRTAPIPRRSASTAIAPRSRKRAGAGFPEGRCDGPRRDEVPKEPAACIDSTTETPNSKGEDRR